MKNIAKLVHSSKWRLAIVAVLAIIVVAGGGYMGHRLFVNHQRTQTRNAAEATARSFVAALNRSDLHRAYALTSDTIHQNATEQEFREALGDLQAHSPVRSQEAITLTPEGATYTVTISGLGNTHSGRTKGTFKLSLLRTTGGAWKVASVSVH